MIVAIVILFVLGGGGVMLGIGAGFFALIYGPGINRRIAYKKANETFLVRHGYTIAEHNYSQAHTAGVSVERWKAMPLEERNLAILSWDLDGKRGGPFISPEEIAWRGDYRQRARNQYARRVARLRKKRGMVPIKVS